jgi:hypothetical protein
LGKDLSKEFGLWGHIASYMVNILLEIAYIGMPCMIRAFCLNYDFCDFCEGHDANVMLTMMLNDRRSVGCTHR